MRGWRCQCSGASPGLLLAALATVLVAAPAHPTEPSDLNEPESYAGVSGVAGETVNLPCPTKFGIGNHSVRLVLWYKKPIIDPIYTYDARRREPTRKSEKPLALRGYFNEKPDPPYLAVKELRPSDEGLYVCRVDFLDLPTANYKVNLTVIERPGKPVILDGSTRLPLAEKTKVYDENGDVSLVCRVQGGRPPPRVAWFLDNQRIDDSYEHDPVSDVTVNHLLFSRLGRQHLNANLTCQVANTILVPPQNVHVKLDVNLKPTDVNILTKESVLLADRKYELECRSTGSRPDALVTWWMGNRRIDNGTETYTENNQSVSILKFVPSIENEGKYLTCRAENPSMKNSAIEDKLQLNVQYRPVVGLQMGVTLNPNAIKEGQDVYFECNVTANPKAYKLSWFKDMKEMRNNQSAGVVLSDRSLVLRGVSRHSAGSYTCLAVNSEGKTFSNPVPLRVMYAPVCKEGRSEVVVGALKQETVSLLCSVESHPEPQTFHWTFNNSGEPVEMPSQQQQQRSSNSHAATSTPGAPTASASDPGAGSGSAAVLREHHGARMNYTPSSEMDYGTVACYASNHVGKQRAPCVFQVIAAGRPSALHNCSATELSPGLELLDDDLATSRQLSSNQVGAPGVGLLVTCLEGYNGGLPIRSYHVDVVSDEDDGTVAVLNRTVDAAGAGVATIEVAGLSPGRSYRLYLYAVNAKGRSEPAVLEPVTLKGVAMYTTGNTDMSAFSPVTLGLAATVTLLCLAAAAILAALYRKHAGGLAGGSPKHAPIVCEPPNPGSTTPVHPQQTKQLLEDTDPDIIPNEYERRPLTSGTSPTVRKTPPAQRRRRGPGPGSPPRDEEAADSTEKVPLREDAFESPPSSGLLPGFGLHPGFAPRAGLGYGHHLPSVPDFKQMAYEQYVNRSHQNMYYSLQRAASTALSAMPPVPTSTLSSSQGVKGHLHQHQHHQQHHHHQPPEIVTRLNNVKESCI